MSDDTRRVLELLSQGKVTVEEADQLLRAIPAAGAHAEPAKATPPPDAAPRPKARYVRIAIHKLEQEGRAEKDVNIRVPLAIVRSGLRLGALIPGNTGTQFAARLRDRGLDIDLSKLDGAALEAVLRDLGDAPIDIDSGKAQIRITCE